MYGTTQTIVPVRRMDVGGAGGMAAALTEPGSELKQVGGPDPDGFKQDFMGMQSNISAIYARSAIPGAQANNVVGLNMAS